MKTSFNQIYIKKSLIDHLYAIIRKKNIKIIILRKLYKKFTIKN
jgi:hypothetical protein